MPTQKLNNESILYIIFISLTGFYLDDVHFIVWPKAWIFITTFNKNI